MFLVSTFPSVHVNKNYFCYPYMWMNCIKFIIFSTSSIVKLFNFLAYNWHIFDILTHDLLLISADLNTGLFLSSKMLKYLSKWVISTCDYIFYFSQICLKILDFDELLNILTNWHTSKCLSIDFTWPKVCLGVLEVIWIYQHAMLG